MGKPEKKLKKIFMILGITAAVYGAFRCLLPLVIPFLIAWGLAFFLQPSAQWLSDHSRPFRIPVGIIGIAELAAAMFLMAAGFCKLGYRFWREIQLLSQQIPFWMERLDYWLTGMCHRLEIEFCLEKNVLVYLIRDMLKQVLLRVKSAAMPYLMTNSVSIFCWGMEQMVLFVLIFISTGLILQEFPMWKKCCRHSQFAEELNRIVQCLSQVLRAYGKTQMVIFLFTSCICTAGFYLMKNPYYILAGMGVGIADALPIFGTGTILIPWAGVMLFQKQFWKAMGLFEIYLICYFLREYLEAKWMGKQVGLTPLQNLIAIYVGLQLFGIAGVVLGPIGFLIIRDFLDAWSDPL